MVKYIIGISCFYHDSAAAIIKDGEIVEEIKGSCKAEIIFNKKSEFKSFNIAGQKPQSFNEIIDTIILARKEFPGQSVSLDSLCRKLKIDNSNRKIHGAIKDAELLLAVYLKLTTGKQVSLSFNDTNQEKNIDLDENQDENDKIIMKDRSTNFTYPKKELLDHKDFIKSIKNSIWSKL